MGPGWRANATIRRASRLILINVGTECIREGKAESIADKVYEIVLPELEKLRKVRGEALYKYATQIHVAYQVKVFAQWCQENLE